MALWPPKPDRGHPFDRLLDAFTVLAQAQALSVMHSRGFSTCYCGMGATGYGMSSGEPTCDAHRKQDDGEWREFKNAELVRKLTAFVQDFPKGGG